ncbi:MAG: hypothetical protein ABI579_03705 [Candidatus Sumerlaeota bacterium]
MAAQIPSGNEPREAVFAIVNREPEPDALVRYIPENFSREKRNVTKERQKACTESVDEIAARVIALKKKRGDSLAPSRLSKNPSVATLVECPVEKAPRHNNFTRI